VPPGRLTWAQRPGRVRSHRSESAFLSASSPRGDAFEDWKFLPRSRGRTAAGAMPHRGCGTERLLPPRSERATSEEKHAEPVHEHHNNRNHPAQTGGQGPPSPFGSKVGLAALILAIGGLVVRLAAGPRVDDLCSLPSPPPLLRLRSAFCSRIRRLQVPLPRPPLNCSRPV